MSKLRVLCRVVTYDSTNNSVLLVRNRGHKWWCPHGGGWEYERETLMECAKREVLEEAGIEVEIVRFLYAQTLYIRDQDSVWLEQHWLAKPTGNREVPNLLPSLLQNENQFIGHFEI